MRFLNEVMTTTRGLPIFNFAADFEGHDQIIRFRPWPGMSVPTHSDQPFRLIPISGSD
jgi:hypothetical protein